MRIPSSAVSFLRSRVINSSSKRVPRRSVSNPAQDGFDVLYDQEGSFMIKGMLSAGLCSAIYWGYNIYDPINRLTNVEPSTWTEDYWSYLGLGLSTAIIVGTQFYSRCAIRRIYASRDNKRIGFQTQNIIGMYGNRYETAVGKARVIPDTVPSKDVRITVDGFKANLIADNREAFMSSKRLVKLLSPEAATEGFLDDLSVSNKPRKRFSINK